MSPQETFVTRLRRHRQRCRISLDEIAAETRVKKELLEALENNDLSGWPKGLYARAWIRAYATAVGIDPGDTVDEFCRLFPQGDRRVHGTLRGMAVIIAAPPEYRDEFHGVDRRTGGAPAPEAPAPMRVWHETTSQGVRAWFFRIMAAAGPYLPRRAPRTTL
jgi:transcriptional regulator with XRE-family HTH domain